MRKQKEDVKQQAVESINESIEIGIEAQEKLEEMWQQGIEDSFEAAQSGLRQVRSAAASLGAGMPWAAALQPATDVYYGLQEKNLESARSAAKAAFGVYRKSFAAPVRKMMRERSSRLAEKGGA